MRLWPWPTKAQRERALHDDRDPVCRWFWGDRSPLDPKARCGVCNG